MTDVSTNNPYPGVTAISPFTVSPLSAGITIPTGARMQNSTTCPTGTRVQSGAMWSKHMDNWIHALIRYETRARIDGQALSIVEVTAHREPPLALVDREDEQRLVSVARDTLSRYYAPFSACKDTNAPRCSTRRSHAGSNHSRHPRRQ